ncbi:MAG: GNAT family N-acetyltransferase [Actinobacteria bacterium]|nr:GNAT family N-acetyltransferase [Actinomycetota bacterium]
MDIGLARQEDVAGLARLVWLHASSPEQAQQSVEGFAADLATWWTHHADSHFPFVARTASCDVVGMVWLAVLPRVPRPGVMTRRSADIQSCYVAPEHRGQGVASALIHAATAHAAGLRAHRVTVQSSRKAVPVYERLGFASSRQLLQLPGD